METYNRLTGYLVSALKAGGGLCLVAMMALTCLDVVLRATGSPLEGAVELVAWLGALVLALALPQTQARHGHVGLMSLVQRLPRRSSATVQTLAAGGSLALCGAAAWQSWVYAGQLMASNEISMTLGLPQHVLARVISLGLWVTCLVIAGQTWALLRKAVRP
ncbi:MAG: TRAP transporter small permease [Proteobacteria bacterium]|nr:TRAP transporter small permease [Pseudomonadota bacterium]MBU4382409.1 TRAP transporter small permease [Pseudomonadota bacterium]MBU4604076.1 TRAP transporter small permease [Pseudomonadota bacterium]MCG2763978.1 TRAP transporter small permease [Desulfarculaceae bacterium]